MYTQSPLNINDLLYREIYIRKRKRKMFSIIFWYFPYSSFSKPEILKSLKMLSELSIWVSEISQVTKSHLLETKDKNELSLGVSLSICKCFRHHHHHHRNNIIDDALHYICTYIRHRYRYILYINNADDVIF